MAKIGNLVIDTAQIASGALTQFVTTTGDYLTVSDVGDNPLLLFVEAHAGDGGEFIPIRRQRGSSYLLLGTVGPTAGPNYDNIRGTVVDPSPQDGDQYYGVPLSAVDRMTAVIYWR